MKHLFLCSPTTGKCIRCGKPESAAVHQGIK